jgi:AcrR family transcriptional regulator
MTRDDRRVRRTRELLQQALQGLLGERDYETITIQDIVDRANVGRTTFYLHYQSKDDLFLSCHEAILRAFHVEPQTIPSREDLLSPEAPPGMAAAYRHLEHARARVYPLFQSRDGLVLLNQIRDRLGQQLAASLRAAFDEADSAIPLDVLATYLAGAQLAMVQWWLKQRQPYSAETLARILQRMQRATIRDAFGLIDQP